MYILVTLLNKDTSAPISSGAYAKAKNVGNEHVYNGTAIFNSDNTWSGAFVFDIGDDQGLYQIYWDETQSFFGHTIGNTIRHYGQPYIPSVRAFKGWYFGLTPQDGDVIYYSELAQSDATFPSRFESDNLPIVKQVRVSDLKYYIDNISVDSFQVHFVAGSDTNIKVLFLVKAPFSISTVVLPTDESIQMLSVGGGTIYTEPTNKPIELLSVGGGTIYTEPTDRPLELLSVGGGTIDVKAYADLDPPTIYDSHNLYFEVDTRYYSQELLLAGHYARLGIGWYGSCGYQYAENGYLHQIPNDNSSAIYLWEDMEQYNNGNGYMYDCIFSEEIIYSIYGQTHGVTFNGLYFTEDDKSYWARIDYYIDVDSSGNITYNIQPKYYDGAWNSATKISIVGGNIVDSFEPYDFKISMDGLNVNYYYKKSGDSTWTNANYPHTFSANTLTLSKIIYYTYYRPSTINQITISPDGGPA